jgi:hypothetical protein
VAEGELVGFEDFSQIAGPLAGKNGGFGFDYDNSTADNQFFGHDGVPSQWAATFGTPRVAKGQLLTSNSNTGRSTPEPMRARRWSISGLK